LVTKMLTLFAALLSMFSVLYNYFNGPTKLFSDLFQSAKLDISTKLFFLCRFCSIMYPSKKKIIDISINFYFSSYL